MLNGFSRLNYSMAYQQCSKFFHSKIRKRTHLKCNRVYKFEQRQSKGEEDCRTVNVACPLSLITKKILTLPLGKSS